MVTYKRMFLCSNPRALWILTALIMSVSYTRHFMVTNRLPVLGFTTLVILYFVMVLYKAWPIPLFTFHHGTTHLILLLSVDDIILIGNNFVALQHLM